MMKVNKSSLRRISIWGSDNYKNNNIRLLLIGVTGVFALIYLFNVSSSVPSLDSATLSVGTIPITSPAPSSTSPKFDSTDKNNENKNATIGKIASKLFNEDPDNYLLNDHKDFPKEYHFGNREYYHHYRKEKNSGAAIEDMLMCHAYSFHNNATYGGSCGDPHKKMPIHSSLLESLGLKDKLPFACPRDKASLKDGIRRSTIPLSTCKQDDTRIWTPEYVMYLRSLVSLPPRKDSTFTIAVHINRRQRISPCQVKHLGFYQYLPNLHFMNVIDKYNKPGAKVHIFSQKGSFESLDDFVAKGYEVSYEDELSTIWHTFVTADVFILSRSDFSMIPALVAQGKVVYTPSWHAPMKGWDVVDQEIMEKTDAETLRLRHTCP